jgi:DNA replication and repair protein RecF
MYLSRLVLQNYRNYESLDLPLSPGVSLFTGDNAQGKTNLLESVYLLATTRPTRSNNDADLVGWDVATAENGVARVAGYARRRHGDVEVTVAIGLGQQEANARKAHTTKRLQVNGVARRASDVVGQIAAVLFTAQDIDLLTGPPALRRRYLDITISQVNPIYLRSLQRYSRILLQRNSLLRLLQEGKGSPDQLGFWNQELAREAASIMTTRAEATSRLAAEAATSHASLSGNRERLDITYQPQLPSGVAGPLSRRPDELCHDLAAALRELQRREIAAGMSLFGPHRDEVIFAVNGVSAASFGSRAQQRTAALALRLAETAYIESEAGDKPVLLLDDILSELDEQRRRSVLETVGGVDQLLVTATDVEPAAAEALAAAHRYRIEAGQIRERIVGD